MIKLPVSADLKIGQQKIIIEKQKFYLLVNLAMKMETEIYKKTGSNVSVFVKNRG